MEKYYINTCKLSKPVLVYNIDDTSNEDRQIYKVVDVILCYQLYFKWALFTVLSTDKQDLILNLIWLKNYNFKINRQKGKIVIIQCLI